MTNLMQVFQTRLEALAREREGHMARVEEIDRQFAQAAEQLGVDQAELTAALATSTAIMPRLPREDRRSVGSMSAHVLELLLKADRGYTRLELRGEVEKDERFRDMIKANVNGFYNTVIRHITKGKVVEVDGLLYHADRAPLPEGEDDPTGRHLAPNVRNLFATMKRNSDAN